MLDTTTNQIKALYSHKDQIVALDLGVDFAEKKVNPGKNYEIGEREILVETVNELEDNSLFNLTSVDYRGNIYIFKGGKVDFTVNFLK